LKDLLTPFNCLALLSWDNQSAVDIAFNQMFHKQTKQIDINCLLVRERVNIGLITLLPVSSSLEVAKFFIKTLYTSVFQNHRSKLGIMDIYSHHEGLLTVFFVLHVAWPFMIALQSWTWLHCNFVIFFFSHH